ncbi:heme lyase CcmF/NrfE family subunit [Limimaricola soesokkakensis]|uniref:heme lyase CcmF/NrfE family subunit n=1 Tax=Limimaricola soesokkakensis TaxID=1343159 RepID=UPI003512D301
MVAEIGLFALVLALMIALAQSVVPLIGAKRGETQLMSFADAAAVVQLGFVVIAFAALVRAFMVTDLSLRVVVMHSNSAMPMLFKVTGVWGNHEGSLLLWVLILTLFGAALGLRGDNLPATLKARVLAVQGMISAAFLALMIFTSNPFARVSPAPADGQELNPLLQDVGLAIHPPFLYLGYVGFSVTFAFAIAALIEGKVDASWARFVRPWVLAAWCFLTIGITLGSFWAYYELGWGGWWFWDPVENASFMPWIVGTALLHSALVVERRQTLIVWTVLLAILTFSLSLVGTFLVRSGLLTSVHAFATDPSRGMGVLAILFAATGGGLVLFAMRAGSFDRPAVVAPVSRDGGLILNNIFLVVAAGTVFVGTFYPLVVELLGPDKISVGPPYFNQTFVPLMIPLLVAVAVGPILRWKRDSLRRALGQLRPPAAVALVVALAVFVAGGGAHPFAAAAFGLAAWLVAASLWALALWVRLFREPWRRSATLARKVPRSVYGMVMAHAGLGLLVAGITGVTAFQEERILSMSPGDRVALAGYEVSLDRVEQLNGENFIAEQGQFTIERDGEPFAAMTSERRFYTVSRNTTTEAGIRAVVLSNLYVAIGEPNDGGQWVVRLYHHPLALLIWLGPLSMAAGGFVSLSDRRMRIGAPQRSLRRPQGVEA